jgi:hypothetical protein
MFMAIGRNAHPTTAPSIAETSAPGYATAVNFDTGKMISF